MKTFKSKTLLLLALVYLVAGCDTNISGDSGDEPTSGTADFSTFVTVGDSLTAGFADGALYLHGQENSYPAILAQQFALVGGGAFAQPLRLPQATGSFIGVPLNLVRDRQVLVPSGNPERPVAPATIDPTVPTAVVPMPGIPYNNFGVPSAKVPDLADAAFANPFFVRMAFNPGVSTMISDAAARMPTFFILWMGNNDLLLNALAGSPGTDNPTLGAGATDVTPTATFATDYPLRVADLKSPTNKGILANIPNVSTIPHFTTVPYNAIQLTATDAANLNAQLAAGYDLALNAAIGVLGLDPAEADRRRISFSEGENPVLISDDTLQDISGVLGPPLDSLILLAQARPATPDDLILLAALPKLGEEDPMGGPTGMGGTLAVWGVTQPLLDTDVLIKDEVDALENIRTNFYNPAIKAAADADPDILFFDAAALLEELNSNGISYGSGGISSTFIQGGGFSLDGVHPTARGYAVIANEMLKVINAGFGAFIPPVDPNDYSTVFYQ